jgi:flagellar motor switch/type III secretory pathway protein FliN
MSSQKETESPGVTHGSAVAVEHNAAERNPADVLPWLPCTASLEIPLLRFTIGDLSRLTRGSVFGTACRQNSDIPLYVNGQLIGWTELEVIDERRAARITEIA